MGRKPNPLVLKYFERGQKLSDSSNRYPHTCRLCGERYPKGRMDALIAHITKKCPSISHSERLDVCVSLYGASGVPPAVVAAAAAASAVVTTTSHSSSADDDDVQMLRVAERTGSPSGQLQFQQHSHASPTEHGVAPGGDGLVQGGLRGLPPQSWNALETLAEASRQVDMNEKHDHATHDGHTQAQAQAQHDGRLDLHDHLMLDAPSLDSGKPCSADKPANASFSEFLHNLSDEMLPPTTSVSDPTTLTAQAAAAAAQLSPGLLDTHIPDAPSSHSDHGTPAVSPQLPVSIHITMSNDHLAMSQDHADWDRIPYPSSRPGRTALPPSKGGDRMDVSQHGRARHLRAKFTPTRRKEVQEVRKVGACIRCRLLRKNCGMGNPCEACRKILSPRVWTTGCVRTKLHEQLELYSAGLHTSLVLNQIKTWRSHLQTDLSPGVRVHVSLSFGAAVVPSDRVTIRLNALVSKLPRIEVDKPDDPKADKPQAVMIDGDTQDLPGLIEQYMQRVLPDLISHEPQDFTKKILEFAQAYLLETEDELLRKALELWGLVELADREMGWHIEVQPSESQSESYVIQKSPEPTQADVYSMFSMQLSAAAERRANETSKALLSSMQRVLLDSKVKIGFTAYLASLILLTAIEKSTWVFKAWEAPDLRDTWPLSRPPEEYAAQVATLPAVLRMILSARRVLPKTGRDPKGKLAAVEGHDIRENELFNILDLDYDHVIARHEKLRMDSTNSRSLELYFTSYLLLPDIS